MSGDAGRICELNDAFRTSGTHSGQWVITPGVAALGPALVLEAVRLVRRFDRFTEDNDPYQEHDFGSFELAGQSLFWKIDYYARDLVSGSPDPSDPLVTLRVLTILLASEY